MREHVKNISDEEFEIQKEAVLVKLAEKDINLQRENARHWGEISTHKYQFDRQEKEIATLSEITKQEFIDLFEKTFFSSTSKRIDIQLTSEAHREEQEEYRAKNSEHEIFTNFMKRVQVDDSLAGFKKRSGMHPDVYKASFAQFL